MRTLLIFLTIFFLLADFTNCEIFTSTDELVKLVDSQRIFIEAIEKFVEDVDKEIETLKSKLTELESEHKTITQDPQTYIENPLNAFILIKTLSHDIESMKNGFRNKYKPFEKTLKSIELQPEDLDGAANGLLRIQEVYKLKSKDLAQGVVHGKKSRKWLSAEQLFTLGNEIINENRVKASKFLRFSLKRADDTKKFEYLEKILDLFRDAPEFKSNITKIDESDKKFDLTLDFLSKMTPYMPWRNAYDKVKDEYKDAEKTLFSRACRGLNLKSPSESSKLFCFLSTKTNSFAKIAPFKVELLNLDPMVAIFHDIMTEDEITTLKTVTRPSLESENIKNYSKVMKTKITKDTENEVFARVTQKIGELSGLNMKSSEPLTVQNYGVGGVYKLHFDHFFEWNENYTEKVVESGNRMASMVIYLSDVEKGGFTVFPFLKVHVVPKKGSAVFWYNLSSSGDQDSAVMHGSCPVVVGSKWVANKMIREHGQEFTRPCELTQKPTIDKYWHYLDEIIYK